METLPLFYLLLADLLLYIVFFVYAFRKKKLIGIKLGMNISQVMGGTAALLSGIVLVLEFPFRFTFITIVSAIIGVLIGAFFGLLFDYQTFLTGTINGMIAGLMAPLIGSVLEMPEQVIWLVHGVFFFCLLFIMLSIQRS